MEAGNIQSTFENLEIDRDLSEIARRKPGIDCDRLEETTSVSNNLETEHDQLEATPQTKAECN